MNPLLELHTHGQSYWLDNPTRAIIENPTRFFVDYMIIPGTMKTRVMRWVAKYAFWLCPGYIWLLKKA